MFIRRLTVPFTFAFLLIGAVSLFAAERYEGFLNPDSPTASSVHNAPIGPFDLVDDLCVVRPASVRFDADMRGLSMLEPAAQRDTYRRGVSWDVPKPLGRSRSDC